MEKPFTPDQVKAVLLAIRDKVTDAQLRMLKAHYTRRIASMEEIASLGGYGESYRAGNLQYGVLCGRIARELGFTPDGNKTSTIASLSSEPDEKGHHQWRMDDVVAAALEELAWVIPGTTAELLNLPHAITISGTCFRLLPCRISGVAMS